MPERISASAENITFERLNAKEMYQLVLSLPEPFRTPVILYYFEDMSIEQIGNILSINKGTVKSRLARGRDRLYQIIVREGIDGKKVERG